MYTYLFIRTWCCLVSSTTYFLFFPWKSGYLFVVNDRKRHVSMGNRLHPLNPSIPFSCDQVKGKRLNPRFASPEVFRHSFQFHMISYHARAFLIGEFFFHMFWFCHKSCILTAPEKSQTVGVHISGGKKAARFEEKLGEKLFMWERP